ncbi:DUF2232 domain-containing protein [Proteiniclasticum sp. C24MP]|uniref:DUF2232 domain-containing protein n=1 Tax=Proteiniclasticum sp. C24MP TaxID=3374101 RepID=UPI00375446DC
MNNNSNTKKLVTSALLVALIVIFSLLGTLPFFSTVSLAVAPIIVALIYHKGGKVNAIIGFFVTLALISIIINPIYAVTMTLLNFCMGAGLIFMIEKNVSPLINFVVLAAAVAVGVSIMVTVDLMLISNLSIMEYASVLVEDMKLSVNEVIKTYEAMGMDMEDNQAIEMFQSLNVNMMLSFIPTMLALYALTAATFIYKISEVVFRKIGIQVKPLPKLSEIKANAFVILGTLLVAMLGIALVYFSVPMGEGIMLMGNNLFTIAGTVGGISLISYYMETKLKYPKVFRIVILFFILFSSLVSVISIIGVIDSAFDFRRLTENGLYSIIKSKSNNTK